MVPQLARLASWLREARLRSSRSTQRPNGRLRCGGEARPRSPMLRPSTPRPLALDLCYDVLAPLCSATQREEYLSGGGRGGGGRAAAARAILWDSLLRAAPGPGGLKASLRVCVTSG
eukprot:scaffold12643_cov69-Phaeocystis_antarctica.AAC.3